MQKPQSSVDFIPFGKLLSVISIVIFFKHTTISSLLEYFVQNLARVAVRVFIYIHRIVEHLDLAMRCFVSDLVADTVGNSNNLAYAFPFSADIKQFLCRAV